MMDTQFFVFNRSPRWVDVYTAHWSAPSNIALVKYWGKKDPQIPKNPSVSFTLDKCVSRTKVHFQKQSHSQQAIDFEIFYDNEAKPEFKPKVQSFLDRILDYVPYLRQYSLHIETTNTFPHSSGIASSASAMAALAACIMDLEMQLDPMQKPDYTLQKTSFLARLGSGSAARSVQGPIVGWGQHTKTLNSSNLFGVEIEDTHPVFNTFCDSILLVDEGQKAVSSTLGHSLMLGHPFASARFNQARDHYGQLIDILAHGDLENFVKLVEKEALCLHAMMLTSNPQFILMQPNTLEIINAVWEFRKVTQNQVSFTLDAGANVHLLYPNDIRDVVQSFIESELSSFCQNGAFIHDRVGTGIKKM